MKKGGLFLFVLTVFLITTTGSVSAFDSPLKVGWVIGWDENNTVILHTKNGGRKWVVQGKWASSGFTGKISAVDEQTAWAAIDSPDGDGIIIHTTNGGVTWTEQIVLEGELIYGLKGLTRLEAWAVSYTGGTILHTTDGGKTWNAVDSGLDLGNVWIMNRMDAIGYRDVRYDDRSSKNTGMITANVWFVVNNGENLGMIHTLYNGEMWRKEFIPFTNGGSGVHMLSAYSPRVVWAAAWADGNLYRTVDGGENWKRILDIDLGGNDIDDMCAYSADKIWFVQFEATYSGAGYIYHLSVEGEKPILKTFQPLKSYRYEGLTCVDDQTAVVVGYTDLDDPPDPSLQLGLIIVTNDGGQNWEIQPTPDDDVRFWKVSFVGAHR